MINIDIVKHSHTETMNWCRHWDIIRWTVFSAVIVAIVTSASYNIGYIHKFKYLWIQNNALIILFITIFVLYLFKNLQIYHNNYIIRHNNLVLKILTSCIYKDIFIIELPYEFSPRMNIFKRILSKKLTATEVLPLIILAVALVLIIFTSLPKS